MSFWVHDRSVWVRRGVTVFAVLLITFSVVDLVRLTGMVIAYAEQWSNLSPMLLVANVSTVCSARTYGNPFLLTGILFLGLPIATGVWLLLWSFALLSGGVGLLRHRAWARFLVLVLGVDILAGLFLILWLYGSQSFGLVDHGIQVMYATLFFLFFAHRGTRDIVGMGAKKAGLLAKCLLGFYVTIVALKFLSAPLFVGYMHFGQRELTAKLRSMPEVVSCTKPDYEVLSSGHEPRTVFGYTLHLPEDVHALIAFRGSKCTPWTVMLGSETGDSFRPVAHLSDKDMTELVFRALSEQYGFRTPYEFERRLGYPSWSPVWMAWKLFYGMIDGVEHVSAHGWKGFVPILCPPDSFKGYLPCTAYDTTGESSARVMLFVDGEEMTVHRAKRILATLEFESDDRDAAEYFNQGIVSLDNRSYTDATLSFLNALYVDDTNPQYAYYLGRSMYEDECEAWTKGRLGTAERFLQYALELDSTYAPARELLAVVNREIEELEMEKSEELKETKTQ